MQIIAIPRKSIRAKCPKYQKYVRKIQRICISSEKRPFMDPFFFCLNYISTEYELKHRSFFFCARACEDSQVGIILLHPKQKTTTHRIKLRHEKTKRSENEDETEREKKRWLPR